MAIVTIEESAIGLVKDWDAIPEFIGLARRGTRMIGPEMGI
jgi:hypothetical protein